MRRFHSLLYLFPSFRPFCATTPYLYISFHFRSHSFIIPIFLFPYFYIPSGIFEVLNSTYKRTVGFLSSKYSPRPYNPRRLSRVYSILLLVSSYTRTISIIWCFVCRDCPAFYYNYHHKVNNIYHNMEIMLFCS